MIIWESVGNSVPMFELVEVQVQKRRNKAEEGKQETWSRSLELSPFYLVTLPKVVRTQKTKRYGYCLINLNREYRWSKENLKFSGLIMRDKGVSLAWDSLEITTGGRSEATFCPQLVTCPRSEPALQNECFLPVESRWQRPKIPRVLEKAQVWSALPFPGSLW